MKADRAFIFKTGSTKELLMEWKEDRRKIIPLFPNSPQGSQTYFDDPFLPYYLLHLLCLTQVKYKTGGKKWNPSEKRTCGRSRTK